MTYTYFAYRDNINPPDNFLLTNTYITEHLKRIKNPNYKSQSEAGFILLSLILSEHFKLDLNHLKITESKYGKPYFCDAALFFNIAHSDNAILCSVSNYEIGVDVEKISEIRDSISNKIFSEYERSQITSPEDFYKLWTLKESFSKLCGKGLSALKDSEFTIKPEIKLKSKIDEHNALFETRVIDNYVVSVASIDTTKSIFVIK